MEKNSFDGSPDIQALRQSLRNIDDEVMAQILKRVEVVRAIGRIKQQLGIEIMDSKREKFNQKRNREISQGKIPEGFVDELSELLAKWSRIIQAELK